MPLVLLTSESLDPFVSEITLAVTPYVPELIAAASDVSVLLLVPNRDRPVRRPNPNRQAAAQSIRRARNLT